MIYSNVFPRDIQQLGKAVAGHPHQKHSAIEFLTSIVFKD